MTASSPIWTDGYSRYVKADSSSRTQCGIPFFFRTSLVATIRYYFPGSSVLWLATHCHMPLCLIQVSVYRERTVYDLPLFVPDSR